MAPSVLAGQLGARAGFYETAEVRVHPTGSITLFTGTHGHGQGHETTFAQVVADQLGVPIELVDASSRRGTANSNCRSGHRRATGLLHRSGLDLGLSLLLLLGMPFHGVNGVDGFGGLRCVLPVELFRRFAQPFIIAPILHVGAEHLQRAAAGIDLIVMGELGEAFENPEQLFVPRAVPDLHIAGTALALRAERCEARQLVATLRGRPHWGLSRTPKHNFG